MTSDEILETFGERDSYFWLREIAYQIAVINEAAGNYLISKKELQRRRDLAREPEEIRKDNERAEMYAQHLAQREQMEKEGQEKKEQAEREEAEKVRRKAN